MDNNTRTTIQLHLHRHLFISLNFCLLLCLVPNLFSFMFLSWWSVDSKLQDTVCHIVFCGSILIYMLLAKHMIFIDVRLNKKTCLANGILYFVLTVLVVYLFIENHLHFNTLMLLSSIFLLLWFNILQHCKLYQLINIDPSRLNWKLAAENNYSLYHVPTGVPATQWLNTYAVESMEYKKFIPGPVVEYFLEMFFEKECRFYLGPKNPIGVLELMSEDVFNSLCQLYKPLRNNHSWEIAKTICHDSRVAYNQWIKMPKNPPQTIESSFNDFS